MVKSYYKKEVHIILLFCALWAFIFLLFDRGLSSFELVKNSMGGIVISKSSSTNWYQLLMWWTVVLIPTITNIVVYNLNKKMFYLVALRCRSKTNLCIRFVFHMYITPLLFYALGITFSFLFGYKNGIADFIEISILVIIVLPLFILLLSLTFITIALYLDEKISFFILISYIGVSGYLSTTMPLNQIGVYYIGMIDITDKRSLVGDINFFLMVLFMVVSCLILTLLYRKNIQRISMSK